MSGSTEWTVRDLAEQAGTTVRTIHYYISEGLLPPPSGATRNATYSPAHLARLRLIAALREEGLALANIRQRLAPLTDAQAIEVSRELDAYIRQPGDTPITTLGLIEAVLASKTMVDLPMDEPTVNAMVALDLDDGAPLPTAPPQGSASEYLKKVLGQRSQARQSVPIPRPKAPPPKPVDIGQPEAWYYLRIVDGVELRVREDRYREARGRLQSVVETLRATLDRYGLGHPKGDS